MKRATILVILLILAVVLAVLELMLGSADIPFNEVLKILTTPGYGKEGWKLIVLESRLPRMLAAVAAGTALSLSGLLMQTLFRNPLAGPHILGVSAGASLGVALVVIGFGFFQMPVKLAADILIVLAAFAGAMAVLFILFLISLRIKDILTVLIFGVLISALCLAIVGILQYLSPESQLKAFMIWTLGSFDGVDMSEAGIILISMLPLLLLVISQLKPLNLLLAGEEQAVTMGLRLRSSRLIIMIAAGALTALVTAYCGPIGFVGVVVPHFARLLFKTFDHRFLFLSVVLTGINVMLFADLIAHLPGSDNILPLNSITSLIALPFLFWILIRRKTITAI